MATREPGSPATISVSIGDSIEHDAGLGRMRRPLEHSIARRRIAMTSGA